MPISTHRSESANALTPYALTRRNGARKDREKERKRREDSPAYQIQSSGVARSQGKVNSAIKPDVAEASLKKAERRIHLDPKTAQKSQSPKPANVRAALHG